MPIDALAVWADIQANPGTALAILIMVFVFCGVVAFFQHAADKRNVE
jgi:hypothetical protein